MLLNTRGLLSFGTEAVAALLPSTACDVLMFTETHHRPGVTPPTLQGYTLVTHRPGTPCSSGRGRGGVAIYTRSSLLAGDSLAASAGPGSVEGLGPNPCGVEYRFVPSLLPALVDSLRGAQAALEAAAQAGAAATSLAQLATACEVFDGVVVASLDAVSIPARPPCANRRPLGWVQKTCRDPLTSRLRRRRRRALSGRDYALAVALNRQICAAARRHKRQHKRKMGRDVARLEFESPAAFHRLLKGEGEGADPSITASDWNSHFRSLLGYAHTEAATRASSSTQPPSTTHQSQALQRLHEPFILSELTAATKRVKNSKSCLGALKPEMLKGTIALLGPALVALLNACVRVGGMPARWAVSALTPIRKPGADHRLCDGYRGIAVGTLLAKLYAGMLQDRLATYTEGAGTRASGQAGFRPDYGCRDQQLALRAIIERQRARGHPLYACFVDFKQAFDRVPRHLLWQKLESAGLGGWALRAVQALYTTVPMCVKVPGGFTSTFEATSGVKQGCPLSPILFGLYLDDFESGLVQQAAAAALPHWESGETVPPLFYADDQALLATTPAGLRFQLGYLENYCAAWGLTVNIKKTQVMVFCGRGAAGQESFRYAGHAVDTVPTFRYLGVHMHCRQSFVSAASFTAEAGRRAMHGLRRRLAANGLEDPMLSMRAFKTYVLPVLSYGAEIWAPQLILQGKSAAQQVQLEHLRGLLGVRDSAPALTVLAETGQLPLPIYWTLQLARFVRSLQRMDGDRVAPPRVLAATVNGGDWRAGAREGVPVRLFGRIPIDWTAEAAIQRFGTAAGAIFRDLQGAGLATVRSSRVFASSGRGTQPYLVGMHLHVSREVADELQSQVDGRHFLPLPAPWGGFAVAYIDSSTSLREVHLQGVPLNMTQQCLRSFLQAHHIFPTRLDDVVDPVTGLARGDLVVMEVANKTKLPSEIVVSDEQGAVLATIRVRPVSGLPPAPGAPATAAPWCRSVLPHAVALPPGGAILDHAARASSVNAPSPARTVSTSSATLTKWMLTWVSWRSAQRRPVTSTCPPPMAAAPAQAAAAEQLPRARGPVLRGCSHNCNGLTTVAAVDQACAEWRRSGYHYVLLQEHHLTLLTSVRVRRRLHQHGWTAYLAFSPLGASGRPRAGTGILIRSDLLSNSSLTIVGGEAAIQRAADGRYIAMPVRWSGHNLHMCSIYMPNNSTQQRQFIAAQLAPLAAAAAGRQLLWGGDFNFAPQPHLDRLGHVAGVPHADVGTAQRWRDALPGLVDVYRVRHPGRRVFTYVNPHSASRLDRFYSSPALLPHIAVCSVRDRCLSDHRPVSLTLVGLLPSGVGPGLRRARLGFFSSPALLLQMTAWLTARLAEAPADDLAFLLWWPPFKRRWLSKCGELHAASRLMAQGAEAAGDQLAGLHMALDGGDDAVLPAIIAARQRFVEAAAASEAEAATRRRQQWLHAGERPSKPLTRRLRSKRSAGAVPALRSAGGDLLTSGTACAQRVARVFAEVSAQPATTPAAQQEVLQHLAAGRHLAGEQAAALGVPAVAAPEVLRALRTAPPGRSPGHDGLPAELYRKFQGLLAPLLARLFTAVAELGILPARFHEGLITVIYKSGDRSEPTNYRPITLLCTDYRLFTKVLALRLNPCLDSIIDREQAAFVPGRHIGENIMALQCLPHLLRGTAASAVVVFCDFRKAYDTIDREFLFSAMDALGVGAGFLTLTRLLLADTRSRAMVNGFTSTPAAFLAGVRQGCPLAPLLYLFIAQALLRLLKARGIGIPVAGQQLTALQYADDAQALLPSLDAVPSFLAAMATFGAATGQRLNPAKTSLLPIGDVPAGLPAVVHGLRVVSQATSLGVTFGAAADPAARWPALMDGVGCCFARIASLPRFSAFGRGFATAAYGVSKLLYHAEFTGHPPEQHMAELMRVTAKVVDRGQAPGDATRKFAGLAGWALAGRPADGGFGALPWREHITSRHAWWGLQLLLAPAAVPWVAIARALLRRCADTAVHPMGLLLWPAGQPPPGSIAQLPPPLRRLHGGLRSLPPVADVAEQPLVLGPWCWAAPLWGNLYFCSPNFPTGIDHDFIDFSAAGVTSLGQLLHLEQAVAAAPGGAAYALVWTTMLGRYAAFASRFYAVERLAALLAALPPAWVHAARAAAAELAAGLLQPPALADALAVLLPRLGWAHPALPAPLLMSSFTVRRGTSLLTSPTATRRAAQYFTPFGLLADAAAPAPAAVVQAVLARLWRVRWENCHKEPFWRLVCDAVPTASRLHMDQPCQCGGAPADRRHHFWTCPVARGVVDSIAGELAARQLLPAPLAAAHIWLAAAPAGVHGGVWDVVSLAAVAAMDHGRRRMYAMSLAPPPLPPLVPVCLRSARARFWTLLTDFVALRCAPASWQAHLPPGHPFIYFDAAAATFKMPVRAAAAPRVLAATVNGGDWRAGARAIFRDLQGAGLATVRSSRVFASSGRGTQPYLVGMHLHVSREVADELQSQVDGRHFLPLPAPWGGFAVAYIDSSTSLREVHLQGVPLNMTQQCLRSFLQAHHIFPTRLDDVVDPVTGLARGDLVVMEVANKTKLPSEIVVSDEQGAVLATIRLPPPLLLRLPVLCLPPCPLLSPLPRSLVPLGAATRSRSATRGRHPGPRGTSVKRQCTVAGKNRFHQLSDTDEMDADLGVMAERSAAPAPAQAAAAEQLPRARGPVLRGCSHNCNGLTTVAAVDQACAEWRRSGYHYVLLQEHHLTLLTSVRVRRRLHQHGWTAYLAFSPLGASGRPRAGTGILIRSDLLSNSSLTIVGGEAAIQRAADGRYIAMPVRWSGHNLHMCSIYMPNNSTQQRQFIAAQLAPLAAAAAGRQLLWGGDFNFAPQPHLDRLGHVAGVPHADVGTAQRWRDALPGLVDVYRVRHPGRRVFTYVNPHSASRLDRFYSSPALLPHIAVCSVRDRCLSDHRPVSLTLVGLLPSGVGPGLRRARLGFFSSPALLLQMTAWLTARLAEAPADDLAFLLWWPPFKRRWLSKCGELHAASRLMAQGAEAAGDQLAGLHMALDGGDDAVLPAIIAARQRFVEAAAASEAEAATRRRQQWLHAGERPSKPLTRRLRSKRSAGAVPALRSAGGDLLTSGTACAQRVARVFAEVSAQPATTPAAQQEVLQHLAAGRHLAGEQAAALGVPAVAAPEVLRALRTAPPGRSPGHDGLPAELYRKFQGLLAPLLARLFTAVAELGILPARFHEGLITVIYKSGDRSEPTNYRPITLLCTDYRLFTKVLALRLNPCLDSIIDREQAAFVPGRHIGENIMALQCLPHLLRGTAASAVVVFCDFRKAYDTIDREFLFSAMDALGVGAGFLTLTRLLLADTRSRAMVNGFTSTPAAFLAGVRQGCPLAPLLYLFIAQALLRLLKARGIGIPVAGQQLTALQYADDAQALLPSLDAVPSFLAAMATFGAATGQRLNPAKTSLLPIGDVPAGLPAVVHGLRVVSQATSLGVTFGAAADPAARWPALMDGVGCCFARIASLPRFSAFGRGFATAAYGVSKLLYHAEFTGHPPEQHMAELMRVTAKVVDRGQAPGDATRKFAGLAGWALAGRPADGGFGALPWREHITSRHAWWGLQLLLAPAAVPWVAIARALLRRCADTAVHPMGLLLWPAGQPPPGSIAQLPPPLRRLHGGLRSLPPVADVAEQPLVLGPWCWAAPLWGNLYFCSPNFPTGIDHDFIDFSAAGVTSLGQLLHLEQAVAAAPGGAAYALVWTTMLGRYAAFASRFYAVERLAALLAALPPAWVHAARAAAAELAAGLLQPPALADALAVLLPRLGWAHPALPAPLLMSSFTVRRGTSLLTSPTATRRAAQYFTPFGLLADAAAPAPAAVVQAVLARLWRVRWENCHKEPFWRLVCDAVPTASRLHMDQSCQCGGAPADRRHHFWTCPVARGVVDSIAGELAARQLLPAPLAAAHIWLAAAPAGVHGGVWDVVSLAAVAAMDHGRRRMYAMSLAPPPLPPLVPVCLRSARARFWTLLTDFVALRCAPASWQAHLPPGHPFIYFDAAAATFKARGVGRVSGGPARGVSMPAQPSQWRWHQPQQPLEPHPTELDFSPRVRQHPLASAYGAASVGGGSTRCRWRRRVLSGGLGQRTCLRFQALAKAVPEAYQLLYPKGLQRLAAQLRERDCCGVEACVDGEGVELAQDVTYSNATIVVALRCAPASWQAHLPPGHPFIYFDAAAATFKVALPAAAAPPM
ncbi:Transposon TX1 uncharacterized protein [Chlorella vulgaris]